MNAITSISLNFAVKDVTDTTLPHWGRLFLFHADDQESLRDIYRARFHRRDVKSIPPTTENWLRNNTNTAWRTTRALRTSMRQTTSTTSAMTWTWTRARCTSPEHKRKRAPCHTLWFRVTCTSWLKFWVPSCHPCTCASLLEFTYLIFYFDLSFTILSLFFPLLHFEQHTELDNLIAMQNLRTSANKGSNDVYDVAVSLTGYEPNFMAFSELNDSSGSFSYITPSSDIDDATRDTRQAAHRGTPRTSRLLRSRRRVSQSVVFVCCVR